MTTKSFNVLIKSVQMIGAICAGIGLSTIIGYISGSDRLYRWYGEIGMALNTGITFFIQGVCFYLIGKLFKLKSHAI